jgi:beta-aspartyl-peptidase (threonine type)
VGDSPIIGAGTFASNDSAAVSATGHGEYFMRWTVARDVAARVELAGETLERAAAAVMLDTLREAGGYGAIIALDPTGKVVFAMNRHGMYRGVLSSHSPARTGIWLNPTTE